MESFCDQCSLKFVLAVQLYFGPNICKHFYSFVKKNVPKMRIKIFKLATDIDVDMKEFSLHSKYFLFIFKNVQRDHLYFVGTSAENNLK